MKRITVCAVLLLMGCSPKTNILSHPKEVVSSGNEVLPGFTLIPAPNALDRPGRIIAVSKDGTAQPLQTLDTQLDSGISVVGKISGSRTSSFGALLSFFGGSINSNNPISKKDVTYDLELEGCSEQRLQLLTINEQLQTAKASISDFSRNNNLSDYDFFLITECVKAKKLNYQFSNQAAHDFSLSLNLGKIASFNPNIKWNDETNYKLSYDLPESLFVYCKYFKLAVGNDASISLGSQVVVKDPIYTDNAVMMSILYQQTAAEYKALCFQAFNSARLTVDEELKKPHSKPIAIITDIDETILSSGSYYARQSMAHEESFDLNLYKQWMKSGIADTIPGSVSFLKYASSKGISIFYLSNRDFEDEDATIENLRKYEFPNTDHQHMLLRGPGQSSSKVVRRQTVANSYFISLLVSSNLSAFDEGFENHPSLEKRDELAVKFKQKFGGRFIILPNLQYGDWQGALFHYDYRLTRAQKDSIQKATIKSN